MIIASASLVGAFSGITNLRMDLFEALVNTVLYLYTGQILILQHETINLAGTPARARVSGESLISGDGCCHPHHGGNTVTQLHTVSFAAGDQRVEGKKYRIVHSSGSGSTLG